MESVRRAGLLHDIGMIVVPEGLMGKEGPLTPEEFELIKRHVIVGVRDPRPAAAAGTGRRVRARPTTSAGMGRATPMDWPARRSPGGPGSSRAAELYDAFTTARPYRDQLTPEMAVEKMRGLIGTVLAPEVHRGLGALVERGRALVFVDEERGKEPGLDGSQVRAAS